MVKIKRKVEMTLPELIEWAWKNDIKGKSFNSKKRINALYFDMYGGIQTHCGIEKNDAFTVEVEEEVTEETIIFRLLEVRNAIPSKKKEWQDLKLLKSHLYGNRSISRVKNEHSVAFYNLNDDMTTTLIWKDGELVGDE
ncbi:hypothetical protein [Staphylococcus hominis]|uniref:hypothetical protein n=1 Tax=Staphylococcus hominis TaxID=1290 RepID=UPI00287AFABE|nr:hypothetical protein [Staphylococcus hominis]MDS3899857.1 hypothetical protein [Staphylococcus hominis]MDS3899920.1 hypothetical protein [Staphylococcus hominis]